MNLLFAINGGYIPTFLNCMRSVLLHGGATGDLGVRTSFSDLAATVCRHLGVAWASGEAIG